MTDAARSETAEALDLTAFRSGGLTSEKNVTIPMLHGNNRSSAMALMPDGSRTGSSIVALSS